MSFVDQVDVSFQYGYCPLGTLLSGPYQQVLLLCFDSSHCVDVSSHSVGRIWKSRLTSIPLGSSQINLLLCHYPNNVTLAKR